MKFLSKFLFWSMLCFAPSLYAQVFDPTPSDGLLPHSEKQFKNPVPYAYLREADIMWMMRVWRVVDMREKMNHPFFFPEKPTQGRVNMMTMILEGLEANAINAYSAYESDSITKTDMFTIPLSFEEASARLKHKTYTTYWDDIAEEEIDTVLIEDISLLEIKRFIIKEEVFFDTRYGRMETRVIGIAPQIPQYINGEFVGYEELFWIYFPEARDLFVRYLVYNRYNDTHRLTYDDVFRKRMFSSRIIKVSNVYDRYLEDYNVPMDALLEAEKLKEEIRNREHDLWSY